MKHTSHNQSEDDFEIEVSDIPASDTPDSIPAIQPLYLTLASRLTQRQRALRGTIMAVSMLLALALIISSYLPARDIVTLDLVKLIPTPTPKLAPGADQFYIQRTLSWSTISLDGNDLPHPPIISSDAPLHLARGRHQVVWHAEPFEPITCTVSVPATPSDTCLTNYIARTPSGIYVKVITFLPSLDNLPIVTGTALVQTAQESLDTLESSTIVLPGEHFFSSDQKTFLGTATQQLRATLRFQLDTDNRFLQPCYLQYVGKPCARRLIQDCRHFCSMLAQPSAVGERTWNIFANIRSHWEYTTLNGQVISQDEPASLVEHLVSLHVTWENAQWHVTILPFTSVPGGLACTLARDKISLNASYSFAAGDFNNQVNWQFATGPTLAAGCVAVATVTQHTGLAAALCLYRFGVLLAVNNVAHLYWPLMPLADSYERSLALHIAALPTSQLPVLPALEPSS